MTKAFVGDQKTAADTLLDHLDHVATLAQEAQHAAEAGLPGDVTLRGQQASDASKAVEAAADTLRISVGDLAVDLDPAVTTAVDAAKQAATSVPSFLGRAYEVKEAAEQEHANVYLSHIKAESSLGTVLALHRTADPDNDDLKAIKMSTTTARVKLQDWWLTRNSSPAGAEAMLGTGDAAEAARAFAGTLDDLCERLGLPDRTSCCHASPNCCCVLLLFHSP